MASMLATGNKVRGFSPGRGGWIFKGDKKNRSTPSIGGEVKLSTPCRKNIQYVKNPFEVLTKILSKTKFIIFLVRFLLLLD
jgi:hypothetical protein